MIFALRLCDFFDFFLDKNLIQVILNAILVLFYRSHKEAIVAFKNRLSVRMDTAGRKY